MYTVHNHILPNLSLHLKIIFVHAYTCFSSSSPVWPSSRRSWWRRDCRSGVLTSCFLSAAHGSSTTISPQQAWSQPGRNADQCIDGVHLNNKRPFSYNCVKSSKFFSCTSKGPESVGDNVIGIILQESFWAKLFWLWKELLVVMAAVYRHVHPPALLNSKAGNHLIWNSNNIKLVLSDEYKYYKRVHRTVRAVRVPLCLSNTAWSAGWLGHSYEDFHWWWHQDMSCH